MGRLASKQGASGGAQPPQHCKRIDLRGVLKQFEASSRPPWEGAFRHVNGGGDFWGVLIESSQRHPSSDPRHLRGIQPKGSSLRALGGVK